MGVISLNSIFATQLKKTPPKPKKNQIVPASMGLCLELAYPITNSSSSSSRDSAPFRHRLPLNSFIDSILRTVYHASAPPPDGHGVRRQIIFTSSSPDACATVNWKQPNCMSCLPTSSVLLIPCSLFCFFFPLLLLPWRLDPSLFFFFGFSRPGFVRIVVRRGWYEPAEHHDCDATQRSGTRLASVEYQRGGRVLKK